MIIEKIEFILLQVIEKEYPLLIQNLKINIEYYHINGKKYYLENDKIKKLKELMKKLKLKIITLSILKIFFIKEDEKRS